MRVEMDDAYVLVYEKKLSGLQELLPLLQAVVQTTKPLVIIAEDCRGRAAVQQQWPVHFDERTFPRGT